MSCVEHAAMKALIFFAMLVLSLTTSVAAEGWEKAFWDGDLDEARKLLRLPSDSNSRGHVLLAWAQDNPQEFLVAAERYLSSASDPLLLEQYWYLTSEWALETGEVQVLDRIADNLGQRSDIAHLQSSFRDAKAEALFLMGKSQEALRLWSSFAYVEDWKVIGPFGNTADSGMETAFGPELDLDFSRSHDGALGIPFEWQALQSDLRAGWNGVSRFLGGQTSSTYYATTAVESKVARSVLLSLDHDSAAKLWWNGSAEYLHKDYSQQVRFRPDSLRIPVQLKAGWNTVLIKLARNESESGKFRFRILDPKTLEPLRLTTDSGKAAMSGPASGSGSDKVTQTLQGIQKLADGPERALLESFALQEAGQYTKAAEVLLSAYENHQNSSWLGLFAAGALDSADLGSQSRPILTELLKKESSVPELEIQRITEMDSPEKQLNAVRELAKRFPSSPTVLAMAGAVCLRAEMTNEGVEYLLRLPESTKGSDILQSLLEILSAYDRPRIAIGILDKALERVPGDIDLLRAAGDAAFDVGDDQKALEYYQRVLDSSGKNGPVLFRMGAIRLKAKEVTQAARDFQSALELHPQSASLWESYGDAVLASGDTGSARKAYQMSLRFNPGSNVRRKLADAEGTKSPIEFVARIAADTEVKNEFPDASSRILVDDGIVVLHRDHSYEEHHRMTYEVLNSEGVEALKSIARNFDVSGETVQINKVRILRKSGQEVDAREYVRSDGFHFPSLAVGDLIEFDYVVRGRRHSGLEDHYWTSWNFGGSEPCVINRYTIITPKSLYYQYRGHGRVPESTVRTEGDWVIRTWEIRDRAIQSETMNLVPDADSGDWLDLTTVKDWATISRWYGDLSSQRVIADKAVKTKALELTKGIEDERGRIHALINFLAKDLNYQTTPFRNSAFIPTDGAKVLEDGFGDCKDKAALLKAMLDVLGIESHIALVTGREYGTVEYLPSPRFNHAINVIETKDGTLWVDSTSDTMPYDQLHASLIGAKALVVSPETQDLQVIPLSSPERDRSLSTFVGVLSEDGELKGRLELSFSGNSAASLRYAFTRLNSELRQRAIKEAAPKIMAEAKADTAELMGVEIPEKPLEIVLGLTIPRTLKSAGNFKVFEANWPSSVRLDGLLRTLERGAGPIETSSFRGYRNTTLKIEVPKDWTVVELPSERIGKSDFGSFRTSYRFEAGILTLQHENTLTPVRVSEQDFGDFTSFVKELEDSFGQAILFKN